MSLSKTVGIEGEEVASQFLSRKGYTILSRNYRRSFGEIDIIAEKDSVIHFIEVKTVSGSLSGDFSRENLYRPEEMAHITKLKKVAKTAAAYMDDRQDNREYQIDVIGVILDRSSRVARCRLFEQAAEGLGL